MDEQIEQNNDDIGITMETKGNQIIFTVGGGDEAVGFIASYLAAGMDRLQEAIAGGLEFSDDE